MRVVGRDTRRRGVARWPVRMLLLAAAAAAVFYFAYHAGRGQSAMQVARQSEELEALRAELETARRERAAALAEAQETERRTRSELEAMAARLPQGELEDLVFAARARLVEGVSAARLIEVIRRTPASSPCAATLQRQVLAVRIPTSVEPPQTLAFADGRLLVAASGVALPPTRGHASTEFDPTQPIELRFLQLGGTIETVRGQLPLIHRVVVGDQEYRFGIVQGRSPGTLELTVQLCPFP